MFNYKEMESTRACRKAHDELMDTYIKALAEEGVYSQEEKAKLYEDYRKTSKEFGEWEVEDSKFNYNIGKSVGKNIGMWEGAACVTGGYLVGKLIRNIIER